MPKRIPTNDNWSGTYEDGTVIGKVSVLSTGEIRISFWGNDDLGLELDLPFNEEDYHYWNKWLSNLSFISMDTLIELGFCEA